MAYTSNSSGSDTEKNEVVYEEKIVVLEFEVKDKGLDDSVYRPTANKTNASVSQVETSITPPSNTSVEMPRVESVRPSEVIIEDWVSDDDEDIFQSNDSQTTVKPSFKNIEFTKARNEPVKSDKQAVKPRMEKVNIVRVNGIAVSTVRGNEVTVVKASAGCVWRPKMTDLNNGSKDNSGSWISKRGNPQQALKYKRMFDSGCSRYKAFDASVWSPYKVGDEAVHKELGDRMEKASTTASSFEAEQDSDKRAYPRKFIQYFLNHMANLEFCDKHHMVAYLQKSEGSEWFSTDHVIFCKVLVTSHVHSLGHDEGSFSLSELTVLCTNLSNKVTSLEAELAQTKQTYGTALTKLIKKVKKLEQTVKSTQARRRFRIVVSDDEEGLKDPSKQGRKITKIDQDPSISLVQDEGTSWIQEDIEIQEKISDDTEVVLEEEEPTKLVEDQGSGEKGEKEVSTVGAEHSTVIPEVSTAAENLVYIRRSAEKKKDKGKGIMTKPEPEKKTKKLLEQERLVHEEAVRFQEQLNEEETQRIARDAEIARQLHEEINNAGQERVLNRPYSVAEVRKNMVMYLKNQGGYKMNYFKGMKYEDIRPIFEKVWDQIQSFAPMDSEKEKGSEKKGRRKKSLARKRAGEKQSKESIKRKKIEDDIDKEELKAYLDLVPKKEFAMEIEFLGTKYPIVDWKTHTSCNGSTQLLEERHATSRPEGYDLMLWGDLKILFQPDEGDKVRRHQHE
ncbi:hypothetical protein Tco_0233459 [Tanacetum coccineum]